MKRCILAALLLAAPASPSLAQSSLGYIGTSLTGAWGSGDYGVSSMDMQSDFAVTDVHGLQLDLGASDPGTNWRGTLTAHLYMAPRTQAKYGLFASVTDTNHEAQTDYAFGAETMLALGARTELEARGGVGFVHPGSNDYIFGQLSARYGLSDQTTLSADLSALDIEEQAYAARVLRLGIGVQHQIARSPVTLWARVESERVTGDRDYPDETRVVLGLTTRLGAGLRDGQGLRNRPFSVVRPTDPLFARGIIPISTTR